MLLLLFCVQYEADVGLVDCRHNDGATDGGSDAAQGRTSINAVPYALCRGYSGRHLPSTRPVSTVDAERGAVQSRHAVLPLPDRTRRRVPGLAVGRPSSRHACTTDDAADRILGSHYLLPGPRASHPATGRYYLQLTITC